MVTAGEWLGKGSPSREGGARGRFERKRSGSGMGMAGYDGMSMGWGFGRLGKRLALGPLVGVNCL